MPRGLARQDFTAGVHGCGRGGELAAEPRSAPARPAHCSLPVCTQRNDGGSGSGCPILRWAKSVQRRDAFRTPQASQGQRAAAGAGATGVYPHPALAAPTRRTVKDARRRGGQPAGTPPAAMLILDSCPRLGLFLAPFPVLRTPSKSSMEPSERNVHGKALCSLSIGFGVCCRTMEQ
jgi:hypothetical protein